MKNYFSGGFLKIKNYAVVHKVITGIMLVVVFGGLYIGYKKSLATTGEIKYVTAVATKGTLVSSISGSGQVSALNQIDIKPKVSGEITWININPGDTVHAYQSLMSIDNTDAKRQVTNAEQSLITSELQYQKDAAESPIDYQKTLDSLQTAKDDLNTTFNDTFNSLSNTYLDLPNVITATQNVLYGYDLNATSGTWNIDTINNYFNNFDTVDQKISVLATSAKNDYSTARAKYDASILSYKQITRESSQVEIEKLLDDSINTTTAMAQALQSDLNLLGATIDSAQTVNLKLPTAVTTMQTTARNNLSTINNDLSSLLSQKKSISTSKQNIKTYQDNITLLQVGNPNGANPISLQITKNNLETQKQNLEQLKENLNDYTVFAPFDGTISKVDVKKTDNVSSGTAVATLVTKQKVAEISLNEVDVSKIKVGEKATLTFDAIDGLTIAGQASEIDTVGTVTQGVVSYAVKISFDTQDDKVKPGMSVNADIITDVKQDVVLVPISSIKTSGGTSYVEIFDTAPVGSESATGAASLVLPQQQVVEIGSANDTQTEIISGITEGQNVVTRTITTATKTTTTPSLLNSIGGTRTTGATGATGATRRFGQ